MNTGQYKTIKNKSEATFRDRGSRFVAYSGPVSDQSEIAQFLEDIRKLHPTARHICYAYRIKPLDEEWRSNDDGEPAGSAGKPILNQIRSKELTNIIVAVVRYFGGTLLGVPGLIHAYKESTRLALEEAEIEERQITCEIYVVTHYANSGNLSTLLKKLKLDHKMSPFEDGLKVQVNVPLPHYEEVKVLLVKNGFRIESQG